MGPLRQQKRRKIKPTSRKILKRSRLTHALLIIVTIITGLLSRHYAFIPLFIGDVLWATLVYFLFRFVLIKKPVKAIVIYSLIFSYAIEFSQLYTAPWMERLRQTLFGKLVLGSVFCWGDLLSYTVGIAIGVLVDSLIRNTRGSSKTA
jgi:hypothetical protein